MCWCFPKVKHLPPKFWVGYTTGRTSNDHADNKNINNHQHDTIVTVVFLLRHKTWNSKKMLIFCHFLFLGWRKLGWFFCLVPPVVQNFDSVAKTSLQQTHLIVLTPRSVHIMGINFWEEHCDRYTGGSDQLRTSSTREEWSLFKRVKITKCAKVGQLSIFLWEAWLTMPSTILALRKGDWFFWLKIQQAICQF